jgi:hypothetical protein
MNATVRKQSETAAILRAGKAKGPTHNHAATRATRAAEPAAAELTRNGKPKQKPSETRDRVMVNFPKHSMADVKAAAELLGVTMSTYFVLAVQEKLARDAAA